MHFETPAPDAAAALDGAYAAALRAGAAIVAIAAEARASSRIKDDASPLTAADLAADAILLDALRALDPVTPVISEETPRSTACAPERFWLVDPLDGTREFLAGRDDYTVNVALVERGVPTAGVVHAPARGVTFLAARGRGATRIDADGSRAIHVRCDGELVVVASRSHRGPSLDAFLRALPPHTLVGMGSALKMCVVAEGGAQLYPRLGPTCWWDTAAAHVVVCEAGGFVTTLDGTPLRYAGEDVRNPPFLCSALPCDAWSAAARAAT